jgi:hypothetical protein
MQLNLFAKRAVCKHCQCETDTPVTVQKWNGRKKVKIDFCTEMCANIYYLEHLRGAGL